MEVSIQNVRVVPSGFYVDSYCKASKLLKCGYLSTESCTGTKDSLSFEVILVLVPVC